MENISPAIDNTTIPFFQETKTFLRKDTITSISDVNYDSQIRRKIIIEITNSLPNTPIPVTNLLKNTTQIIILIYILIHVYLQFTHSHLTSTVWMRRRAKSRCREPSTTTPPRSLFSPWVSPIITLLRISRDRLTQVSGCGCRVVIVFELFVCGCWNIVFGPFYFFFFVIVY